jgi:hypothetical protein
VSEPALGFTIAACAFGGGLIGAVCAGLRKDRGEQSAVSVRTAADITVPCSAHRGYPLSHVEAVRLHDWKLERWL